MLYLLGVFVTLPFPVLIQHLTSEFPRRDIKANKLNAVPLRDVFIMRNIEHVPELTWEILIVDLPYYSFPWDNWVVWKW